MNRVSNDTSTEENPMRNVLNILMHISFPYIFIVSIIGICGNFLTIIMLSRRSLSKNFNNCTLIALALTDLIFNFTLVSRGFLDIIQFNSEQLCRLLSFLSHLAELLSACFTAHFTAQRFIAVRFPLSVFIERKIHLIHYFIVSLVIILGIVYCLALVKYNAYDSCHEELDLKWFISDALLSFLIPFTVITILNILIVFHLKKGFQNNQQFRFIKRHPNSREILPLHFRKKKSSTYELALSTHFQVKIYENTTTPNSRSSLPSCHANGDLLLTNGRARSIDLLHRSSSVRPKSQSYRVTRMLIIVSTCFLLFNAPAHICTISLKIYTVKNTISDDIPHEIPIQLQEKFKLFHQNSSILLHNNDATYTSKIISNQNDLLDNKNDLKWMKLFYIIVIITNHIAYASYSINFFLYSLCGMKFRRELIRCMSQQRRPTGLSRSTTIQNAVQ